jgi:2-polyprenyl-3-methyl-5-hydroxy-6-metoxy-1,4-benzoquinol methylase
MIQDEFGTNQIWGTQKAIQFRDHRRAQVILNSIVPLSEKKILELGPGSGFLLELLKQEKTHYQFLAIEKSRSFYQNLKKQSYPSCINIQNAEAITFLENNLQPFSHITGVGILHHIWYHPNWVSLLKKNIEPNGSLIFIEPNPHNPLARFIFSTSLGRALFKLESVESLKTPFQIQKELAQDFQEISITPFDLNYPFFNLSMMRGLTTIEKKIPKILLKSLSQSIIIQAKVKQDIS